MTEPFRVLLCDPPWAFKDKLPGRGRGASKHYGCMHIEELKRFELPPLAKDAVLFMWKVAAMPQEALDLVRAWGFTPKSEIVWEKRRKCGPCHGGGSRVRRGIASICKGCDGLGTRPAFGMGHYVRAAHETCIIATRGRPQKHDTTSARNVRSTFEALMPTDGRGKLIHSAKPDEINRIAERLYPGPYVEIFAGRQLHGWTCLGNESGADGLVSRRAA